MSARPNIVLVHGAFADGSCWSGVIERLQADGYRVTAPQFPLTALADDVARLRQVRDGRPGVENAAVLVPGRRKLAAFWAAALGRPVDPGATPESAAIAPGDSGATGPRLSFHQVPEPKSVKNRPHLDLISNTFEAESQRLVALGASRIRDVTQGSARWTTFADPEGNEFDLIAG